MISGLRSFQKLPHLLLAMGFFLACGVVFWFPLSCLAASIQQPMSSASRKPPIMQCLSAQEEELIRLVNVYRKRRGLGEVAVSQSLVKVARTHVLDLQINRPDLGKDPLGVSCNMHSWSSRGYWQPVCYTDDHRNAALMRSKPSEITSQWFDEIGYEVAYWTSRGPILPLKVISSWIKSPPHRAMLFETDKWANTTFRSVGVGFSDNFAVLWYSPKSDPNGFMPPCDILH
jgi:hypothetical protein